MAKEKEESQKKIKRPTAKKRDLQSIRRNLRNRSFKSSVKTAIRSFKEAQTQGNQVAAKEQLNKIFSLLDKGVKRNQFKLNKVSRIKARLSV
jgi:small subunit ribosomal protein S20